MSEQAERFVITRGAERALPDPCHRRRVLMALAEAHTAGPLRIETQELGERTGLGAFVLWQVLMDLHRAKYLQAFNIGGLMTVRFPFDFPTDHPAYVHVSPDSTKEAANG
ncbi:MULTISPECIES: hypothetical protein [Stappiaceae]|jgi:hypothetical protein|uniref:hypothetical protein n=1 Tax=Stappiaceae TaxID=2821832 RepID=UPI001ADBBDFD|nr:MULTISPECIES: hypothetical protein [Stappiaceae]MBO9457948.1 hypothetical protein [Labrenzia sp. R5_0]UES51586.1 hypothetical protein GFK88_19390 [Roseibium aggregatum]